MIEANGSATAQGGISSINTSYASGVSGLENGDVVTLAGGKITYDLSANSR